jgi:sugar lactone lactonase YvrE
MESRAGEPANRWFRPTVVAASVIVAAIGSVLLATRASGDETTEGITATLHVAAHPGAVAAGADVLWVAVNGDPGASVGDRPILRLDLATGTVAQTVRLGGEVADLARDGDRLIASVKPVADGTKSTRLLIAVGWRSGVVLPLGRSHLSDTVARKIDGPVDKVIRAGTSVWALETRPGRLLQLAPSTLEPLSAPIRLSSGRTLGLTAGDGYLWVTAADAGEVLRIDPATRALARVHVGGSPVGIVVVRGQVWFADRSDGTVVRLDSRTLRPVGDPIHVGERPSWLAAAGDTLFVTDQDAGTIARIDVRSGRSVGQPIRIAPPAAGGIAPAVVATGESVWVTNFASNTVTRITSRPSHEAASNELTLKGTGNGPVNPGPYGFGVVDGGVSGTGHFTVTGSIEDTGTYTAYRSVNGSIANVRHVLVGTKGTITIVTTIHLDRETLPPWRTISGTERYEGLRARGKLIVDNFQSDPYTFVMTGRVLP